MAGRPGAAFLPCARQRVDVAGRTRAGECPRSPEVSIYRSLARGRAVPTRATRAGATRPDRRRCHRTVCRPVAGQSEGRSTERGRSLFACGVTSPLVGMRPELFRQLSSGRGATATWSPVASSRRLLASGRIGHAYRCPGGIPRERQCPDRWSVSSLLAGPLVGRSRRLLPGGEPMRPDR